MFFLLFVLKNIKKCGFFFSFARAYLYIIYIYAHGLVIAFSALLIDSATVVSNNLA